MVKFRRVFHNVVLYQLKLAIHFQIQSKRILPAFKKILDSLRKLAIKIIDEIHILLLRTK